MLRELIKRNRSYRRFHENEAVDVGTLRNLVDLARLSASAGNIQPLKYILSCEPEKNALIFRHLAWAGYLRDWPGPVEGERPPAYIVVLGDTKISRCEFAALDVRPRNAIPNSGIVPKIGTRRSPF